MVDGCVLCTSDSIQQNNTEIKIELKHTWKQGNTFSTCPQTQNVAG